MPNSMTRSAPSRSGRVETGVATVESTASRAPAVWGDPGDGGDVADGPQRIARRLDIDQPRGAGVDCRRHGGEVTAVDEVDAVSQARRLGGEPVPERPIHHLRHDEVRRGGEREHDRGRGRHAGTEQCRLMGFLEGCQHGFGVARGGIAGPAIGIAGTVLVVGIAHEGRRQMERRHHRLGGGLDQPDACAATARGFEPFGVSFGIWFSRRSRRPGRAAAPCIPGLRPLVAATGTRRMGHRDRGDGFTLRSAKDKPCRISCPISWCPSRSGGGDRGLLGLANMKAGFAPASQRLMRLRVLMQFIALIVIMLTIWIMRG